MRKKLLTIAVPSYNAEKYLPDTIPTILSAKNAHLIDLLIVNDGSSDGTGEIAEEFGVSRQAVYDNIKRTEKILEDYEMKLHMYSDYIVRSQIFDQISDKYPDDAYLQEQIAVLSSIDNRE